jgi:hypothetical protein
MTYQFIQKKQNNPLLAFSAKNEQHPGVGYALEFTPVALLDFTLSYQR